MDKHMIHIDDLVRQKLGGAEEHERPAPWLQMRELLDKEMPIQTIPAAFNWRRLYSAAAGLLLLATAGGGGYALYHSSFSAPANAESGITASTTQTNGINTPSGSSKASTSPIAEETIVTVYKKEGSTQEEIVIDPSGNNGSSNSYSTTSGNKSVSSVASKATSGSSNRSNKNNSQSNSGNTIANRLGSDSETNISGNNNNQSSPSLPTQTLVAQSAATSSSSNLTGDDNSATQTTGTGTQPSDTQQPILASASTKNSSSSKMTGNGRIANMSGNNGTESNRRQSGNETLATIMPNSSTNTRKTTQQIDSQRFTLVRDTFQKITMRKRYLVNTLTRTGSYITDTLAVERVSIDKWVAKEDIDPVLAAAYKKDAKVKSELVPLSSLKVVKSRKTGRWDAQQFKDIVRDAKFNMSQIRFYQGITGGINASLLGPSGLTGFQLGMTGLFTFGEKWGASIEAKFFQRFNGNQLDDNYYVFGTSAGNTYRKKVEHNFKFSNTQSVELPIAVRYTIGRFTGLAGANIAYNFAVNAEEFSRIYDSTGVMITPQYNMSNDHPTVGISDFNSRFTGGYLVGINYQVTPAIGLDMRMAQNVWNGTKGAGAQKVFNELYKSPSFQISVGYRFSKNPRFPKAR